MSGSVSFDRAANEYDKTRTLSSEAAGAVTDTLFREIQHRQPALEIGIGTGRISLPLAGRGIDIIGVDLSSKMLARLRAKDSGRIHFAMADATRLPFGDKVFGSSFACHVFHLIPNWTDAVGELVRVTRDTVLVELGGSTSPFKEITDELARRSGLNKRFPGLATFDDSSPALLDAAFAKHGIGVRLLEPIIERDKASIDEGLRWYEEAICSWAWPIDESTRHRVAAEVREWAAERFGPTDTEWVTERPMIWRAYEVSR